MTNKSKQLIEDMKREPVRERVLYVDGVKIIGKDLNEPSEQAIASFRRSFKDFIRDKRIEEQNQSAAT